LAICAGTASLDDVDFLEQTVRLNRIGKHFFYQLFDELGIRYLPSHTNFVTIVLDSEKTVNTLYDKLLHKGVIVRPLKAFGLPNCIRISTGLQEENEFFAKALKEVL
jgi:histidinol-phosphate aminotransferase